MKVANIVGRILLLSLFAVVVAALAGCGAPQRKPEEQVFFPPAPELPRIKYLAYFTSEKDLSPHQSAFDRFVVGEARDLRLDKPYGVAIHDGKIYVCDTNSTVLVFDLEKRKLAPLRGAQGLGKLIQPLNISIDKEGNKYVTDPIRGQVVIFDKDDMYRSSFGEPGKWKPVDAVVYEGLLYVADIKNNVVKVFDKRTGDLVREIGNRGEPKEVLGLPTNLAFDSQGYLYVSDAGRFQIVKYDRDGHFSGTIGKLGSNPNFFARPRGITVDRKDRLYAVDAAFNNVQIFDKDGHLLLFFGKGGIGPGDLYVAAQVAVDYDNVKYFQKYADPDFEIENIIIVTSQFERRLVNVYAMGKLKGKQYPTDEQLMQEMKEKIRKAEEEEQSKKKAEEQPKKEGEGTGPEEPQAK